MAAGVRRLPDLVERQARNRGLLGEAVVREGTRQFPKRPGVVGGSIYWAFAGAIQCRQRIVALVEHRDSNGRPFCELQLDPEIVPVRPRAKKPFQGWRYLEPSDAPADLVSGEDPEEAAEVAAMPEALRRELGRLGVI